MCHFLESSQIIKDNCNFESASLPTKPNKTNNIESESSAILVFTRSDDKAKEKNAPEYKLSNHTKNIVGRNPNKCQLVLEDRLTLISGCHLEIEFISNTNIWNITDTSSNGIYINGSKLQNSKVLESGDIITLGDRSLGEKSTEFLFELNTENNSNNDSFDYQFIDCDILYFLLNSQETFTDNHEWLLDKAVEVSVAKIAVVCEINEIDNEVIKIAEKQVNEISKIIKLKYPDFLCEVNSLFLQSLESVEQKAEIEEILKNKLQKQQDKILQNLEKFVDKRPEDILIPRLNFKLIKEIEKIEKILEKQKNTLQKQIELNHQKQLQLEDVDIKEKIKKSLKEAEKIKNSCFKQVKIEIEQEKAALLDVFNEKSILTKVKDFCNNLKGSAIFRNGYCDLKLILPNDENQDSSVAMAAHKLCKQELINWASKQWEYTCNFYSNGGITHALNQISGTIKIAPDFQLSNSLFQPPSYINVQSVLQNSFVLIEDESSIKYKQPDILGYTIKSFRGQVISGVGAIALIGSTFISRGELAPKILPIIIPITIISSIISYRSEKAAKLDEATQSLKEKSTKYYQLFAKQLVGEITQAIIYKLEAEEEKIKSDLEKVNEDYQEYIRRFEKQKISIKSQNDKYKLQQRDLETEIRELQKFKRI